MPKVREFEVNETDTDNFVSLYKYYINFLIYILQVRYSYRFSIVC